jgi:elongation factor G
MDSVDGTERFDICVKNINDKFKAKTLVLQLPIGYGKDLQGMVDIVEEQAYYFQSKDVSESYRTAAIPTELVAKAAEAREQLIAKLLDYDEELALRYLEEGYQPTKAEIKSLIRKATLTGEVFPVFCGSAYKYVGVKLLLDGVVDYLPSPIDSKEVSVFDADTGEQKLFPNGDPSAPCLALAFKVTVDRFNNKLTFFRIYSGKLTANSYIYNVNKDEKERISRLVRVNGEERKEIKEIYAGDIVAAVGLEKTVTGDTFSNDKTNRYLLENISFAEPVISQAIEPKTNADRDKLRDALARLTLQDPSFRY